MALDKIDIDTLDPERTIVVATGNAHKLTEIEAILGAVLPEVRFVALGQLGDFEDPEENGTTFVENAIIKAEAAVAATGLAAIADDSGLVVDALDGEPGVYSARYAGVHGDDAANNAKLLRNLGDTPDVERTARFMSVIALIEPSGAVLTGTGACEGTIGHEGRGDHGFGYDPLFLPDDTPGKTMAELMPEEKNAISHRFHALQDLSRQLVGSAATPRRRAADVRAVVQRVSHARVSIGGELVGSIRRGYLILLGVGHADTRETAEKLWGKIFALRINDDAEGKTNLALDDVAGEVLVVSQFTLFANCKKGRRPSFTEAAPPAQATELYEYFVSLARADVPHVATGRFGANMQVELVNDGPFTIVLDTDEL